MLLLPRLVCLFVVLTTPISVTANPTCFVGNESEGDYESLLDALDDGCDDIFIRDGLHEVSRTVEIRRPVDIVGESKEGTILTYKGTGSFILVIQTMNVRLDSLTLDAATYDTDESPIYEAVGVFNSSYTTLSNSYVYGSDHMFAVYFAGPYVDAGQPSLDAFEAGYLDYNNVVENNVIYQSRVEDVLSFSLQSNGRVSGNTVNGGVISFFMNKESDCTENNIVDSLTWVIFVSVPAEDNLIKGNTVTNSNFAGIKVSPEVDHLPGTHEMYRAPGITIKENVISSTEYFGIEISNTHNALVKSNTVTDTAFSAIYTSRSDKLLVMDNGIENYGRTTDDPTWSSSNAGFLGDHLTQQAKIMKNTVINTLESPYGIRINPGATQSENKVLKNELLGFLNENAAVSVSMTPEEGNKVQGNNVF